MSCRLPGAVNSPSDLWQMLIDKRVANSDKVPKSRFNIDAFLHANEDRPGSFKIPGGYYLDGKAEDFDPTFFNMTPVEAMWLDPQQRKMLEVCYEAIESAGLSLESISGSNTAVFCGSFTADYQQMTFKDHDFRHNYAATGVDVGVISARIGNIFDLKGPSALINTACSSAMYAVHNACHALRARDCDAALCGGVNIIMSVDQHMNTANLGIMSPTNMCHTFDASADGYGRAEGAGALYLKRLDDAVRDGDVIRSVIRSSSCNTNGKIPGYGITFPNVDGQEQVIRRAYERADLDPNETAYFETHGTGTPVGDPIEVRAVSRAMNDTRSLQKPLLLGALKPNIGHSEAASGIFAIIKASLMVENGIIPGVAGLVNLNPAIHEDEWNVRINRDARAWPEGFESRRASISSFGYGGTNAHVILENVEALVPGYKHAAIKQAKSEPEFASELLNARPLLITMSAHDKTTLANNIKAHRDVVEHYDLYDFEHTLSCKRSMMSSKAFAIVSEQSPAADMAVENFSFTSTSTPVDKIAFIFTGQGAAWPSMGREAIKHFPVFRKVIHKLDLILRGLEHAPAFSIEHQLSCSKEESNITEPNVAQVTLSAIQIAMVDLLASWGVFPTATIGHSAGEIAASYAAGLVSAPEAIVASYYRGYCLQHFGSTGGSMLAVGKGVEELASFQLDPSLTVACENSPNSVTLSGPIAAIEKTRETLASEKIFVREVKTGMAYHSTYMESVAEPMAAYIDGAVAALDSLYRKWRCESKPMMSTVFNRVLSAEDIDGRYWAMNLTSPVKFNTGVALMAKSEHLNGARGFVEVGPHSALSGPFKQICQSINVDLAYFPTIVRPEGNAATSLLKTAGRLFVEGYPLNLAAVNEPPQKTEPAGLKSPREPLTIIDLPRYQWNYEKVYWAEPRASAEYRQLTHARHDLLGRRILGLSDNNISWRNVLRLKDLPWLEDHKLGGSIMFPCAGYLALAIEAVRQHCEINHIQCTGTTLRNVELKEALVIPSTDSGIEIQVRLTSSSASKAGTSPSYSFAVESIGSSGAWSIHSTGSCTVQSQYQEPVSQVHPVSVDALTQRHSGKVWNSAFGGVGFEYGRQFGALDKIRTGGKNKHQAAGEIPIKVESGLMKQGESRYFLHPATVDSLLQLIIIAIHGGDYEGMPWGVIPVKVEEVTIQLAGDSENTVGKAVAWLPEGRNDRSRHFLSDGKLFGRDGQVLLDIKGLHTLAYEAALPPQQERALAPMPYAGVTWKPDVLRLNFDLAFSGANEKQATSAAMDLVDMANHKHPLSSLLLLDAERELPEVKILQYTSLFTDITIVSNETRGENDDARITRVPVPEDQLALEAVDLDAQDLIILGCREMTQLIELNSIALLEKRLGESGQAILLLESSQADQAAQSLKEVGLAGTVVPFADRSLIYSRRVPRASTQIHDSLFAVRPAFELVYSPHHSTSPTGLATTLEKNGYSVAIQTLKEHVSSDASSRVVLLFIPNANILAAGDVESFEMLKQLLATDEKIIWLTTGVNQGQNPSASMVSGLLRVVREENKASKATVLDYDFKTTLQSLHKAIVSISASKTESLHAESEYWLTDGLVHVSRVVPNTDVNMRMLRNGQAGTLLSRTLPRCEPLRAVFSSGKLAFQANNTLQQTQIGVDELQIQVEATEFKRTDLQQHSSSPRLIYGTVLETGTQVQQNLRGKPIMAYTTDILDTVVRVPAAAIAELTVEPSSAAKRMQSLPTMMRACSAVRAASGDSSQKTVILISASVSFQRSMIALSHWAGFRLIVVQDGQEASLVDDITYLLRDNFSMIQQTVMKARQHAVVISETFSSLEQRLWREMPAGASLVISGTEESEALNGTPSLEPFKRGARFSVASVASTLVADPDAVVADLRTAMNLANQVQQDEDKNAIITLNEVAGQKETPLDAAVLTLNYDQDTVDVASSEFSIRFSSEDVYLLVGCLGGLGRSLTMWMAECGAKHFAFISRSGADRPAAAQLVEDIRAIGAVPRVFRGDATKVSDIKTAVDAITKGSEARRIRGVVHAAMVLNDVMLHNMTLDTWNNTLSPKVGGALALNEVLASEGLDADLDFFVMTSSISATAGPPGQTNYAAANAFLDNLALSRNVAGKPATSLVLPMILGVGVIAEKESGAAEDLVTRRGLYGDNEREMLRGFAAAMSQPKPSSSRLSTQADAAVIMGLEPTKIGRSMQAASEAESADVDWFTTARFSAINALSRLLQGGSSSLRGDGSAGGASFIEKLSNLHAKHADPVVALEFTARHIIEKCSAILMTPTGSMELDGKSPGAYGLDSMIGVELRNWLFKELGLNIAFQDLLATTLTFRALAAMVLEVHGIAAVSK
ncbi:hypothetical protein QQS21_006466 [Conoideocrella luteorostrata]|uniref:Polyketide synthase n=1 Tax=Conoideocrella luteorostrata TaxID=1105319 RepID=A0AAJ0CRU3_9HYPO|nr:hypothetical protein QQS21_006466 [Conoideocrella luteorostrata]